MTESEIRPDVKWEIQKARQRITKKQDMGKPEYKAQNNNKHARTMQQ